MSSQENYSSSPAHDVSSDGQPTEKNTASSVATKAYDDSATPSMASSNKSSERPIKVAPLTREDRLKMRAALDKARVEHLNFLNDPSYFRKGDKLHMIDKLSEELKQYLNASDITRVLTNLLEFLYDPSTRPEDPVDYFAKLTKEKKIDKRELNKAKKELFRLLKKEYALKDEIAKLRKMLSLLNPVEFDEDGLERSPSQVALRLEQIRVEQERRKKEKEEEMMAIKEQEEAEMKMAASQLDGSELKSVVDSEGDQKSISKSKKSSGSRRSKKAKSVSSGKTKKKSGKKKTGGGKSRGDKKTKTK